MDNRHRKYFLAFLLIAWTVFVLCASLTPGDKLPVVHWWDKIPYFDKIAHFGFYFVEAVLFVLMFRIRKWKQLWVLGGIILFSGTVEILQQEFFSRSGDITDLAANTLGAICGLIAVNVLLKKA